MDPITAIFILILFFGILRRKKSQKMKIEQDITPTGVFPYDKKNSLLIPVEQLFLDKLLSVVNGKYKIYVKINMTSILDVKKNISESAKPGYLKKIRNSCIDYVICESSSLNILCAISLEKRAQVREGSEKLDNFISHAFQSASLSHIRFKASHEYSEKQIAAILAKHIDIDEGAPAFEEIAIEPIIN